MPDISSSVSLIMPMYNEAAVIEGALRHWFEQDLYPSELILVNNRSSDGCDELARQVLREAPFPARVVDENEPGVVPALRFGATEVKTDVCMVAAVDCRYPRHYTRRVQELFAGDPQLVVTIAATLTEPADTEVGAGQLQRVLRAARRFPTKCHGGGAGQAYRTQALIDAGNFDMVRWPFVLEDHEIIHRLLRFGRAHHDADLWIHHPERRVDRSNVRWNEFERFLYRHHPLFLGDLFFYRFLWNRFEQRGLRTTSLREQPWNEETTA